jgi:hypothetical protein
MGFAFDSLYMPLEAIEPYYVDLGDPAKGEAKVITSHVLGGPMTGNAPSAVQILSQHGLLGPDTLIPHGNFRPEGDGELYAESGAYVSSTASTELQMGFPPVTLRDNHYDHASLGVDCHSWTSASVPTQTNLLLQYVRCKRREWLKERGMWSRHTGTECEAGIQSWHGGGRKGCGHGEGGWSMWRSRLRPGGRGCRGRGGRREENEMEGCDRDGVGE